MDDADAAAALVDDDPAELDDEGDEAVSLELDDPAAELDDESLAGEVVEAFLPDPVSDRLSVR